MKRYYLLLRPPMPGTIPRGCIDIMDFGKKKFVPEIGREAWGYVEYERELTEQEINDYELEYKED